MYGDRPAAPVIVGSSWCLLCLMCLLFLCFPAHFFHAIWIYLHWRIPWSTFQESHQLGSPTMGGGPRGEAPADNLDIAQASFELPWQIHPSLNPNPTPSDSISICSTLKNILQGLAATSLICWRSCHCWSFFHSTPHHLIHYTLEQKFGNVQYTVCCCLQVYMDSGSLVYSLGCGFSGSPAAPSGTSSPVVQVWDADASTDPPWRIKQ